MLEVEMVEYDDEVLAYALYGNQSKSLEDGIYTQYNFQNDWKIEEFVRGTLRLNGWSDAWKDIFDILENKSGDLEKKIRDNPGFETRKLAISRRNSQLRVITAAITTQFPFMQPGGACFVIFWGFV